MEPHMLRVLPGVPWRTSREQHRNHAEQLFPLWKCFNQVQAHEVKVGPYNWVARVRIDLLPDGEAPTVSQLDPKGISVPHSQQFQSQEWLARTGYIECMDRI